MNKISEIAIYLMYVIVLLAACKCYILSLMYNLHMFQLNGYNNKEHLSWIKQEKNKKNIKVLKNLTIMAIISLAIEFITENYNIKNGNILFNTVMILCFLYGDIWYSYFRRVNNKKRLVLTKRVQRLLLTINIITISIFVFTFFNTNIYKLALSFVLVIVFQIYIVMIANILNKPIEKYINNTYINDAKNILRKFDNLKVIGITGSYGKTSVKFYLETLLSGSYNVLITPESYNTPMGIVKTIRGSLKPIHDIFICEMGAKEKGDIKEICDIVKPDWGLITAIGPQHLESFGDLDCIIKTKFELAESIGDKGIIFLNGENENILKHQIKNKNVIYYSTKNSNCQYYVTDVVLSNRGTEFTLNTDKGEKLDFKMKLIGEHNIINVVGAISIAHALGIELKDLLLPVRKLKPANHRMEIIERGNVVIIDDAFNSNPIGSKAAVETLSMFDGLKILVTPGMVELGDEEEKFNYNFGTYAAKSADYILLIGDKRAKIIEKGVLDSNFNREKCMIFNTLNEAMEFAYSIKSNQKKYILLENDLTDNY